MFSLGSIEFYVMLTVVAALIFACIIMPRDAGDVGEYLLAGELRPGSSDVEQMVEMRVRDDGSVELLRCSVPGVAVDGAVSLAVTVHGLNVDVEERIVAGKGMPAPSTDALFVVRFLKRGRRYSVKYNSGGTSTYAAFSLSLVSGQKTMRRLHH